jgi:hypothetical protein
LEVDFSAIEAKLTGWCARDPEFIRLASLGVHGAVASHILGKPYDPRWSDADLLAYFGEIKASNFPVYDRAKRAVYGDLYGQTAYGMMMTFQESFPTLKIATQYKAILHAMAPTVPKWQNQVRERAYQQNFLGGPGDHPFGYKHWFWSVLGFRAIPEHVYRKRQRLHEPCAVIQGRYYAVVLGEDAKRCVAFYPQSIAAAILKEALLRLFEPDSPSYIGDAYFGRTPLRAPIHDSGLFEIPNRAFERVLERIVREMTTAVPELPLDWVPAADRVRLKLGSHLAIGVEAKAGKDWASMEKLKIEGMINHAGDEIQIPMEDLDEEDFESMRTVWKETAGAA